ncbi:hypothetical protein [Deinococcus sp. ME38]|uniref:hypothetical protein n=1 Tax=Deinococcus sp. ME38 TaxID=3400344 RepID=UPI003B5C580C
MIHLDQHVIRVDPAILPVLRALLTGTQWPHVRAGVPGSVYQPCVRVTVPGNAPLRQGRVSEDPRSTQLRDRGALNALTGLLLVRQPEASR